MGSLTRTQSHVQFGIHDEFMHRESEMRLHVTKLHGLAQRGERVTRGDEFMGKVAGVPGIDNRARDGGPVQLLPVVQLVAIGHAAGVKMADPLDIVTDQSSLRKRVSTLPRRSTTRTSGRRC